MRAIPPNKLTLALALASAACQTGGELGEVDTETQAILGGTAPSPGQFPTVVGISISGGQRGICTGTLIAPDLVLTAAHCIHPQVLGFGSQQQVTNETVVYFDGTILGNGTAVGAAQTIPHGSFSQPGDPDVGLIRLAQPRTDREPSPINLDPAAAPVGMGLDMVGYGVNDGGQAGQLLFLPNKLSVSCSSSGFSDNTFMCFNQQDGTGKCSGDSGGPSFAAGTQTVVGITSFGDQNCQFFGADMRVDASAAFLATNAPELACGGDGVCDSGCATDPDCPNCSDDDDCGTDEICNGGFCVLGPDGAGGLGSACGSEQSCEVGVCASGPDGMRCTIDCQLDGNDCPDGFECLETTGNMGACWPGGGGGCSTSGTGGSGLGLILIGLALALRRRRRD